MNPVSLPAHNPGPMTGDGTRTWLLRGCVPALIDAGTGHERHIADLGEAVGRGGRLDLVLITHAHGDHMAGAPAIARRWPRAVFAKRPWPERDAKYMVTCAPLEDGAVVAAGDETLEVVHTPGHSPDHVCLWHAASRSLFCGDMLIEGGTVVIPATRGGSLADYLRSLERLIALRPQRAFPAHGPIIERPVDLARSYLAHRQRREGQVLDALASGAGTAAELAARIYERLPGALRPVAEESVLAHLHKLEAECRVRRVPRACDDAAVRFETIESAAE